MSKNGIILVALLALPTAMLAHGQQEPNASQISATAPEIRQMWQIIAEKVASLGSDVAAAEIRASVSSVSDDDLVRVYGQADLDGMVETLTAIEEALDSVDRAGAPGSMSVRDVIASSLRGGSGYGIDTTGMTDIVTSDLAGFPNATGYPPQWYCPNSPDRSDGTALQIAVDAIMAVRILLEGAKVAWSALSRVCEQVAVVCPLPGGGNTSVACIAADVVLFAAELAVGAAEGVVEHFQFCDSEVDSAEIEGTYERAGHIHTDLMAHDEDLKELVNTQFTALTSQLSSHDTNVMNELSAVHAKLDQQQLLLLMMRPLLIENNLALGVCPAWMYKPEYLDDDLTDPYRGYLEEVFAVVQKTINDARLMGCPEERQLVRSQFILDKTRELFADGLPIEGGKMCAGLAKAYNLATLGMGQSCRSKSKPKKR